MTEESYLHDLEQAAAALAAIPDAYSQLRDLLASLPDGTPPDLRAGRTGVTAQAAGTGGLDATGLTIQSNVAIGSESGAGSGISQAPEIGLRNFFRDSRLSSAPSIGQFIFDTSPHQMSQDWTVVAQPGTTGAGCLVFGHRLGDQNQSVFRSGTMGLETLSWTAAGNGVLTAQTLIHPGATHFDSDVLPYFVFSIAIYKDFDSSQQFTNCSSATVELVIRDASDTTDLAVSTPLDFMDMGVGTYRRMWVALSSAGITPTKTLVVRIKYTTTGSGGGAANADFTVAIGNPQWELSPYQLPNLYIPEPLGGQSVAYMPHDPNRNTLAQGVLLFSDTPVLDGDLNHARVGLGLGPADEGAVTFATGVNTPDSRIRRTGTSELTLDNAGVSDPTPTVPLVIKHIGPFFAQGPPSMDLAVAYGTYGPTSVDRTDAAPVSATTITYDGTGKVTSIQTVRFGRTFTLTPGYTGANITSVHRAVT
jgi:hypothetical protein